MCLLICWWLQIWFKSYNFKGVLHINLKLTWYVCYLKIIYTCFEKKQCIHLIVNCPRNSKMAKCCFILNIDLYANIFPINMSRSYLSHQRVPIDMSRSYLSHRKVQSPNFSCWKVTSLLLYMKSIGLHTFYIYLPPQKEVKDISTDYFFYWFTGNRLTLIWISCLYLTALYY